MAEDSQLTEQPVHAVLLDFGQGDLVDAGCALRAGALTTPQASRHAADRIVAPRYTLQSAAWLSRQQRLGLICAAIRHLMRSIGAFNRLANLPGSPVRASQCRWLAFNSALR